MSKPIPHSQPLSSSPATSSAVPDAAHASTPTAPGDCAPRGRGVVAMLVYLFERLMPDPFVLSIGLTVFVCVLALIFGPNASWATIEQSWFKGVFGILGFALQMILILATGYAIADAPLVQRGLRALAARAQTPTSAAMILFPMVGAAAWLNWGLGLIVGALLAREIARRTRLDFAWLVAGSYSAWSVCNSGLSSSVALSQASHGNVLNLVEKATGHVVPLSQTVFAPFVLIPSILVVVVMGFIFIKMHPRMENTVSWQAPVDQKETTSSEHGSSATPGSFAYWAERSPIGTILLLAMGLGYLATVVFNHTFDLDINTTILIFLLVGLALHGRPLSYANSIRGAAKQTGSMLLQYPMYGGMMGIMTGTGLAASIAKTFVAVASAASLPLWSFVSSLIITLLIPSAGGHWAVQGPFVLPAALQLHASVAHTAMGVAMAENVSNMLQPFWAVPVVAIAGIRIQRVMGYTAVTFLVSLIIYAAALLFIP